MSTLLLEVFKQKMADSRTHGPLMRVVGIYVFSWYSFWGGIMPVTRFLDGLLRNRRLIYCLSPLAFAGALLASFMVYKGFSALSARKTLHSPGAILMKKVLTALGNPADRGRIDRGAALDQALGSLQGKNADSRYYGDWVYQQHMAHEAQRGGAGGANRGAQDSGANRISSDGASYRQFLDEAKEGYAGPAAHKILEGLGQRGVLDNTMVDGKSMRQYIDEAQSLARKANEQALGVRRQMAQAEGIPMKDEDPEEVVSRLIDQLNSGNPDAQVDAAMTFNDMRYAAYGEEAVPYLENALNYRNPELQNFARMALQKIRFCQKDLACRRQWRK